MGYVVMVADCPHSYWNDGKQAVIQMDVLKDHGYKKISVIPVGNSDLPNGHYYV
jgi:hypothetical protein